ncbi:MAG TPA: helix-turn-helix domain-containing protein [Solirubrobacteraceae bacterium]|nr:helix-turn-helix domain-containing protein [Solirubrobacteraceae bacterium]
MLSPAPNLMPATPSPKRHPYHQWAPDARALDLVGDKWTLLIVRDLSAGPRRFVELQRVLPGISTEQLRSRLNRMVADGLLTRQRYREVPPRVDYELTQRSRELLPVLGALARWGYDWAWTAPREGEAIDIGAILRIAPGLIDDAPASVSGTAELVVTGTGGQTRHYAIALTRGKATIAEQDAPDAAAHISGSEGDWIDALGPDAVSGALSVSGDARLAKVVIDGVCAGAARGVRAA